MRWVLAAAIAVAVVEIFLRLPIGSWLARLVATSRRVVHVVRSSRISDHWKEKVLLAYAGRIFGLTLLIGLAILLSAAAVLVAVAVAGALGDNSFVTFMMSPAGLVFTTVVALAYLWIRKRLAAGAGDAVPLHGYDFGSRLLHRLALASPAVAEASLDADQAVFGRNSPSQVHTRHVFVAGLARAGTTVLMRRLYQTGAFRSLTYRDMPFVLAPNLWQRISGLSRASMQARERAHGDGILVDFDSPEALEEVFWRVIAGGDYIREDCLVPMQADAATQDRFRRYVAAILCSHPGKRYLSKNNNNVLRLPTLAQAFPNAAIIIPFREPRAQAMSLWRQHVRFSEDERDDAFTRAYMGWLAHHEFGPGHRPFVFNGERPAGVPDTDPDYWLTIWIRTYRHILETAPPHALFVSYDRLCMQGAAMWDMLVGRLELPKGMPVEALHPQPVRHDLAASPGLLAEADDLHDRLHARAIA